ncbi:hypothetical protein ABVT39_014291 [Epinephelus coioides]
MKCNVLSATNTKLSLKQVKLAEAEEIVGLWQNLPAADKGPVVYPSHYRAQLSKGRFKRSKTYAPNAVAMPGLESMKWYMFAQS